MVRRTGFAVLVALTVALMVGFAVRASYRAGYMVVDVSDGDGHGPDNGSPEWRDAARRAIPSRSVEAGAWAGVVGFLAAFRALRPRAKTPRPDSHPVDGVRGGGVFSFHPRWKEELVCSCPRGSFILEMTMGVTTVYLPTAERWPAVAPGWAGADWTTLHRELAEWCRRERIPLCVEATAWVVPLRAGA